VDPDEPPSLFLLIRSLDYAGNIAQDFPDAVILSDAAMLAGLMGIVCLLLLSALFSGSEVALFSLDSGSRERLANDPSPGATRVLHLLETPRSVLVSILILNTLVNVAAAILAALLTHSIAQTNGWNPWVTVLTEVVVLAFVLLVVSEITPKLLANRSPATFAKRISGILLALHRVLYPLSFLLARTMKSFNARFHDTAGRLSADDLKTMAEIGEAHGHLEETERELIHSIVEFGETSVREIMVSRLDVVALPADASIMDAIMLIRQSGRSRIPLYVGHLDNILGIIYAKDILRFVTEHPDQEKVDWTRIARPAVFVPLFKKLDDLLADFQTRKTHIAMVVDEYGGTAGLVTLEDVLEEIVGDIRDEQDETEFDQYERLSDTEYMFDARIDLDEINDIANVRMDTEQFDFETLGGLMFHLAGEIPNPGDTFQHDQLEFTVEEVENNRVVRVRMKCAETDAGAPQ